MISKENLKHYQDLLTQNEDKIILAIGFILVAVLSFGAGKLSEVYYAQTPIVFQDSSNCIKSQASANTDSIADSNSLAANQGKIIGNKNSKIYHLPGGGSYAKISEENRVYFASEADAQKAGYRKARN